MKGLVYDTGKISLDAGIGCEILGIRVTEADPENQKYRGELDVIDHVYNPFLFTEKWSAESGDYKHEVDGKFYYLNIRNARTDPDDEGRVFNLQPGADRAFRKEIIRILLQVNPNIPYEID